MHLDFISYLVTVFIAFVIFAVILMLFVKLFDRLFKAPPTLLIITREVRLCDVNGGEKCALNV